MNNKLYLCLLAFLLVTCDARSLRKRDTSNGHIMKGLVRLLDEMVFEDEIVSGRHNFHNRRRNYKRGCGDSKPYTCTLVISGHPKGCSKFGNICKLSCGRC